MSSDRGMEISKEQFVKLINSVIKQIEKDREVSKALESISSGYAVYNTGLVEDVINAIDFDGTISWWIWDGPDCGKRAEEFPIYLGEPGGILGAEKVIIKTPEDLYEYYNKRRKR